uniref:protein Ycf2-like n=1 Tax=Oncorhynchus gorbuscha TaxID=8017 RepID=UPI001EAF6260|nr:protein Ycf2-like [Oncorhynchus gorbuscha]
MTAKHRGKKNKHNHEDFNHFNHESSEPEARGGNQYTLLFILFVLIVVGGATAAWFCFQQHQSITYLADNLMGMQMKMVKLQSFQEEIIQTNEKLLSTDGFEHRLNTLEESYELAQKQVGMALAIAEQLKTSDLPTQVLSLHTEMKARLAEMQQATVSADQLTQLQAMLKGKSEEFEAVRLQVEGLARVSTEMAQSVEGLTGSLAEAESKLEEREGLVGTLSATLEGQTSELLGLKEQLAANQAQLEASTVEIASVKELMEMGQSQRAQQDSVEEQLVTVEQSLHEQNSAAHSLHSELLAQLEAVQKQVAQLEGGFQTDEPSEEVAEETALAAAEEVEEEEVAEETALAAAEEVEEEEEVAEETALAAADTVAEEVEEEQAAEEEVVEKEAAHLDGEPAEQEDSALTEEQTAPAEEEMVEEQEDLAEAGPEEWLAEENVDQEDSEAEEEQGEEEDEKTEEDEASPEEEW